MADSKISALTAATTPLAGTELVPVVQGGATVKVAVSDLTLGRAVNTAGGTFTNNLVQGTAAKGINFTANTPAAGMTSQLLNWYEEGTWTPVVSGGTTAGTYELNTGSTFCTFTRKGRDVSLKGYIVLAAAITGGGTGNLKVTGLPFTKRANSAAWGATAFNTVTFSAGKTVTAYFGTTGASSNIFFWESARGASVTLTPVSSLAANSIIGFSIDYEV